PRFPGILDTGHNHNFSINGSHLRDWAAVPINSLRRLGQIEEGGDTLPLFAANVWIHCNRPRTRNVAPEKPPFLLRLDEGIAVQDKRIGVPRLPLLGLRALARNDLFLTTDGGKRCVHLRTLDWRTKLLRWLV
ncbi:MAG TPA: hypothetical protein VE988_29255, partial [Gemmataceae bacterium]|nr:hypothetical protein [Gemmataceae bacterium]